MYSIDKKERIIQRVREDFAFIGDRYLAILIFGSHARDDASPISDIDVCIITNNKSNNAICYNEIYPNLKMDIYDVVIFENCDDELKAEIAKNHIVVFCRDNKELEKYLQTYKYLEFNNRILSEIAEELRSIANEI